MTKESWRASTNPTALLKLLGGRTSERKLRLFGCACCRLIWPLFTDERCRVAVEVAERYADRQATVDEMAAAWEGAKLARDLAFVAAAWEGAKLARTSWAASELVNVPPQDIDVCEIVRANVTEAAKATCDIPGRVRQLRAAQVALLRDIFGNPHRPPPALPASLLSWQNGLIVRMATAVYEERVLPAGTLDGGRLAVLCDALLDAGCPPDHELLLHLRRPEAHVRGPP
jgi:hypothetical protein